MATEDTGLWLGYDVEAAKKARESGTVAQSNLSARTPSNTLDKDSFLQLLLIQMQYQDPLNPASDTEMLGQMAQFSSLEALQNMASSYSYQQAYALIGKAIYAESYNYDTSEFEETTGIVDFVRKKGSNIYLVVGDKEVELSKVQYVYGDGMAANMNSMNNSMLTNQTLSLIGKFVQAVVVKDGVAEKFVEGKVDYIKFDKNGLPVLVVGNEEVYAKEVGSVSDKLRLLEHEISYETKDADGNKTVVPGGEVQGVNIRDNQAYLVVDGVEVLVKNIGIVSDALNYIGEKVSFDGSYGTCVGVVIRDGKPYLDLGEYENQIDFAKFKGVDIE